MPSDSYYGFRPYVPVAERRRQAEKAAKKLAGKGRVLVPVRIEGRTIATTFWGQAWCRNLEAYSDFRNRLPRGRTYVRNGSVIDLQISAGSVTALVQGSSLYTVTLKIKPLAARRWDEFKARSAGRIGNMLDLLQGRLSKDILADLTAHDTGLFPSPDEIDLGCSCPDWADMCKHVAAVLYGIGARLDHDPALFFTLRGVDVQELFSAASTAMTTDIPSSGTSGSGLPEGDLAAIFGVEIETRAPRSTAESPVVTRQTKAKEAQPTSKRGADAKRPGGDGHRKPKPAQPVPTPIPSSQRRAKANPARHALSLTSPVLAVKPLQQLRSKRSERKLQPAG